MEQVDQTDLIDVGLAGGIDSFLQFGCVDFDVFTESLAGLGQVQTGLRWPMDNHKLPGFHLIDDLLYGVAIRATFVVYVRHPCPRRWKMGSL